MLFAYKYYLHMYTNASLSYFSYTYFLRVIYIKQFPLSAMAASMVHV